MDTQCPQGAFSLRVQRQSQLEPPPSISPNNQQQSPASVTRLLPSCRQLPLALKLELGRLYGSGRGRKEGVVSVPGNLPLTSFSGFLSPGQHNKGTLRPQPWAPESQSQRKLSSASAPSPMLRSARRQTLSHSPCHLDMPRAGEAARPSQVGGLKIRVTTPEGALIPVLDGKTGVGSLRKTV